MPDLTGFWNEDINKPQQQQQVQWKVETYKGLKYNTADIKQTILFPEHSGNITIDPFQMTFVVRQPVQARWACGQKAYFSPRLTLLYFWLSSLKWPL